MHIPAINSIAVVTDVGVPGAVIVALERGNRMQSDVV